MIFMKSGKTIKRVFFGVIILLSVLFFIYRDLIIYGLRQGKGQLNIIWKAKPVEEFLADPDFPDSLKVKLSLIYEIRQFAIDSLALKDTKNYKTLYDQKGEEVMWVVTASEPYGLKAKEWIFPVLGSVPYKGFFRKDLAMELAGELEKEGWDVSIRNPGGWSTLGWFTDPILSKMLERPVGDLANLIIHEMSHATIFVRDSIDFNENLATFIGDRGAEKFLISKYGKDSEEYTAYVNEDRDYLKFSGHMLRGCEKLDSLYNTMTSSMNEEKKREKKMAMIRKIVANLDTLRLITTQINAPVRYQTTLPNNADFLNFRRYQAKQEKFWEDYHNRFNGDLRSYIEYLTNEFPFL